MASTWGSRDITSPYPSGANRPRLEPQDINHDNRFSFMPDAPLQLQSHSVGYSSPTSTYIDESPAMSPASQQPISQPQKSSKVKFHSSPPEYEDEKKDFAQLALPYHIEPPRQPHPALSAPYAEPDPSNQQQYSYNQYHSVPLHPTESQHTSSPPVNRPTPTLQLKTSSLKPKTYNDTDYAPPTPSYPNPSKLPPLSPTTPRTPTYNPHSLAGPNAGSDNASHKPGQVAHPNSVVQPHWSSSLCALSSTCCLGLTCPCILYGRTQHRLSQKTKRLDPTDLLGHSSATNSACALMAASMCFGGLLAGFQRGRVRRMYGIEGSVGDDCLKGCCCCCCVLALDEREVEGREERRRRFAGPVTAGSGYVRMEGMEYAAPPR